MKISTENVKTQTDTYLFINEHKEVFTYNPTAEALASVSTKDLNKLHGILYTELKPCNSKLETIRRLHMCLLDLKGVLTLQHRTLDDLK